MNDLDRANAAQAEMSPEYKETHRMAELLPVLRRNGVSEYNNDVHGVRIKFADRPALEMSLKEAERVLTDELERALKAPVYAKTRITEEAITASKEPGAFVRTEPPAPVGSVEPLKYDIQDVLFGAK